MVELNNGTRGQKYTAVQRQTRQKGTEWVEILVEFVIVISIYHVGSCEQRLEIKLYSYCTFANDTPMH